MNHHDIGFEIKEVSPTGTFCGYGSVYGVIDQGDDIIQQGAFSASLAELAAKGRMPALLWQHNAREPIGAYTTMKEDTVGLYVEGKLALKTQRGAEAHEFLQMNAVSGLSVGFMTREDTYDHKTNIRTIKRADLWEVSLVTFPANDAARVSAVKSVDDIIDLKTAERFLRESGNYSRAEATALVARIKSLMQRDSAADAEAKAVIAALSRRDELLRQ
jgi:HK97 family phage prohead protease